MKSTKAKKPAKKIEKPPILGRSKQAEERASKRHLTVSLSAAKKLLGELKWMKDRCYWIGTPYLSSKMSYNDGIRFRNTLYKLINTQEATLKAFKGKYVFMEGDND